MAFFNKLLGSGETLDSAELYDPLSHTGTPTTSLLVGRHDQTAALLPNGEALLWGGVNSHGGVITFGEVFDPISLRTRIETTPYQVSNGPPTVEGSIPAAGSDYVAVNSLIAARFSKPLLVSTVNSATVTLADSSGTSVSANVVPSEGGMLAFITPQEPLLAGTSYTMTLSGAVDSNGNALPQTLISFRTAGTPPDSGMIPVAPGDSTSQGNLGNSDQNSRAQQPPPVQAPRGITALAGQTLQLSGVPLEDVTLVVEDQQIKTKTDRTGRFLLRQLSAGHHVLLVDATTASRKNQRYGIYEIGVDIVAGRTNVLSYTIWMTELDTAHGTRIPSPTTGETVVSSPLLPGLEVHIPAGTVIKNHDGQVTREISITPIPLNQPPFPLPAGVHVPIYFTVQPGAAYLEKADGSPSSAQLYYPNTYHSRSGTRYNFWNYDADQKGWYIYGQGTVAQDGKQIVPDKGVSIYEFTGAMVAAPDFAPGTFPPGSSSSSAGDPVDLASGLFVYSKTDLTLPDVIPIALTRTYRPADGMSRAFGIGAAHFYDMFLVGDTLPYTYQQLILPNGSRIQYNRISPGTGFADAIYVHSSTNSIYYGSLIAWNGVGWNLTLRDGTVYSFPDGEFVPTPQQAALLSITDRNGNTVSLTRDGNANLTQITSPNGRSIQLTYDSDSRVIQAQDNSGRIVSYTYDASGRLDSVTDVNGGKTTYTFDDSNNMLTITDPRNITYITNEYDSNNRVIQQTMADGSTYQFSWTLSSNTNQSHFVTIASGYTGGGPGVDIPGFRSCSGCQEGYLPLVSQVDVTDPRGHIRRVVFGSNGYVSSDTHAFGETGAQTTTYAYFPDNLLTSTLDSFGRTTAFAYDNAGNATYVSRLAGTGNAVSTSYAYESTFNQLQSVTDPMNHTTSFAYDSKGNVSTITDPLNHATTFTYNSAGQALTVTDPLSHTTTLAYDFGDLVSITDPLNRTTTRFLNSAGQLASLTDPLGQTTHYAYNPFNQITNITDPQGNSTVFAYDGNGNPLSVTDANGHTTTYTYDSIDRVATRKDPLGNSESHLYDAAGNLISFTDRRGKVSTYTYDNLNRKTFAGFGNTSGSPYESTIVYSYDAGNRLTSIVDSVAGTITPTFDALDRLTSEQSPQGTVSYGYDAASRRTTMAATGQSAIGYFYDDANHPYLILQGSSTISLAYDDTGRRTSLSLPNGVVTSYNYDVSSELTGINYTLGSTTLGNLTYTYDLAGRRISAGGSYARAGLPLPISSSEYNVNNQLTQWGTANLFYDENGNMTSDGTNSYVWNGRNQLASMDFGVYSFQYDASGRRSGKAAAGITTKYLYDGANVTQESSGGSPVANLLSGGVDQIFTRTDSNGTANFLTDGLGSALNLTDASANSLAQYTYEPFGNTSVNSGSSTNSFQYTGRENDGTGVYFYRNRYYSPTFQRFISEDPIGIAGGGPNLYAYVGNNPISFRDSLGLSPGGLDGSCGGGTSGRKGPSVSSSSMGDQLQCLETQLGSELSRLRVVLNFLKSVPWTLSYIGSTPEEPLGPALAFAYNPSTKYFCGGGGLGASVGRNFSAGPLLLGNLQNSTAILSGWSIGVGVQGSPLMGFQVLGNLSGILGGPTVGTEGGSVSATWSWCGTI